MIARRRIRIQLEYLAYIEELVLVDLLADRLSLISAFATAQHLLKLANSVVQEAVGLAAVTGHVAAGLGARLRASYRYRLGI